MRLLTVPDGEGGRSLSLFDATLGRYAQAAAIHQATMPGMDSRAACVAVQRRKFPIGDLVRPDLDGRAATEGIVHAPFFVQ